MSVESNKHDKKLHNVDPFRYNVARGKKPLLA
jgi:hypothetical protein